MLFDKLKKRLTQFILSVVSPSFLELEKKIEDFNNEQQTMIRNFEERLYVLEENVRNNNKIISAYADVENRLFVLEENVRNNNEIINAYTDVENRLFVLEENVRNNNEIINVYTDVENRLFIVEENIRSNNDMIDKIQKQYTPAIWEAKLEAVKNNIRKLKEISQNENNDKTVEGFVTKEREDAYGQIDYFSFENYFRGDEKLIKERQKIYLPYFQGCKNVLDLGCGRGEFLELLKENNINATGVDTYDEFAIYCRNKGLDVIIGDAISTLASFPDKLDGIFAGQLVEHLAIGQIVALCEQAYSKLKEGSYLIMETPNPISLTIYTHSFYIDPSHQKPVHPLTLKYLTEKAGFKDVQILFTEGSKPEEKITRLRGKNIDNLDEFNDSLHKVEEYLYGSQDYAIIARR